MLPPFIIEQIRRREEEERERDAERPVLELPLPPPARPSEQRPEDEKDRGVIIIDLTG